MKKTLSTRNVLVNFHCCSALSLQLSCLPNLMSNALSCWTLSCQLVMVQKFKFNNPITKAGQNPDKQLDMYSAGALPVGFKSNFAW